MKREVNTKLQTSGVVFVDTDIVIEAVRTRCWNAISGQRQVVTVEKCAEELQRGDPSQSGYVPVTQEDIDRMTVEALSPSDAVGFRLEYAYADGMDDGERDLLAFAYGWNCDFVLCCCDKAAVRAAYTLGWIDCVTSLEALSQTVGVRPNPPFKPQFTETRMGQWRTSLLLGGPI